MTTIRSVIAKLQTVDCSVKRYVKAEHIEMLESTLSANPKLSGNQLANELEDQGLKGRVASQLAYVADFVVAPSHDLAHILSDGQISVEELAK